jgi:hypothetical protein
MKSAVYLFFFVLLSMLCNAQQSVIFFQNKFSNHDLNRGQKYYLPKIVSCKVIHEKSQKLILDHIIGDTFFFEKPAKDSIKSYQLYQNIEFIQFHNSSFSSLKILADGTKLIGFFLGATSMVLQYKKLKEQHVITAFGVASLASLIVSTTFEKFLPLKIKPKKYSLFVK